MGESCNVWSQVHYWGPALRGILWSVILLCVEQAHAAGFTLSLEGGKLYGPGNLGVHTLQDGDIRNFIVTGALTGHVPMMNNKGSEPNIFAETLHVNEVDGLLSDSTRINENVNVGFVLDIREPETGEMVKLFVCSISGEEVTADAQGNIHFALTAGFDPGLPDFVVKMPVEFVTGVAIVPLSEKTRRQEKGGADNADRYPSGYRRVGRHGDFDNDGMLDGEFVLGGHAPYKLIIAEGDPILVVRPFTSDIPVDADKAALYALKGIAVNYPDVITGVLKDRKQKWLGEYVADIEQRLVSIRQTVMRIRANTRRLSARRDETTGDKLNKKRMIAKLDQASAELSLAFKLSSAGDMTENSKIFDPFFAILEDLVRHLEARASR